MRHRFAIAAFVLSMLLVACSGDDVHDQRIAAPRTGRFELTIAANATSGTVSVVARGSFDDERRRYSFDTDVSGFVPGLDGHLAIIATPDVVFVDCPYLSRLLKAPTAWISVRGPSGDLFRTAIIDPRQLSDGMSSDRDASVSVEYFDVGTSVVIEPPAQSEVTDETDALNRLMGGTTGG
jgi:hypothetical protein